MKREEIKKKADRLRKLIDEARGLMNELNEHGVEVMLWVDGEDKYPAFDTEPVDGENDVCTGFHIGYVNHTEEY